MHNGTFEYPRRRLNCGDTDYAASNWVDRDNHIQRAIEVLEYYQKCNKENTTRPHSPTARGKTMLDGPTDTQPTFYPVPTNYMLRRSRGGDCRPSSANRVP
ncbi:hypothetical protein EVAR_34615_1 [Eumeta japonica]|uniref:Uncharacterized protein n=1 Tax=Eumeta variegata TaxID=151549 RepID=A0A4C1VG20_EUMVA|nr:hypothetical protein EVAR_34615_1 [Eumeta japonica]